MIKKSYTVFAGVNGVGKTSIYKSIYHEENINEARINGGYGIPDEVVDRRYIESLNRNFNKRVSAITNSFYVIIKIKWEIIKKKDLLVGEKLKVILDGLTEELLENLSYESKLGKSLKNTLRKFEKEEVINELLDIKEFYESTELLSKVKFSYRVKSIQSCMVKYKKNFPNIEMNKCYNDLLGIRIIVDDYSRVFNFNLDKFKIADMRNGKKNDDGYRGVHIYYQKSNKHYPIEIQINSKYDRTLNDWLHIYLYKVSNNSRLGILLREKYENSEIKDEKQFKEELKNVLSISKEI